MGANVREIRSRSRLYRVALTGAAVYAVLRFGVHIVYLSGALTPAEYRAYTIPVDLQIYVDAARAILGQQDLYLAATRIEVYQYPPAFALAFAPFLLLSPKALVAIHTLLHMAAYVLLYRAWDRILGGWLPTNGRRVLAGTLPVWLVFTAFWSDLGFLNMYILLALLGTLAIEAILDDHLGRSVLWLVVIIQIKPHWAFPLLLPLLLGRVRFFARLVVLTAAASGSVILLAGMITGRGYVWQQHLAYVRFLLNLRHDFPWRGPGDGFLGYSHSITQLVVYRFGVSAATLRGALVLKIVLLLPLGATILRRLARPARQPGPPPATTALDWAFALYAATFIWLDMVWEFSLGIALFAYTLATVNRRSIRAMAWLVFLPYALLDAWRLFSVAAFGFDVIAPGVYIVTDPSVYLPVIMVVILFFYALLVTRLWGAWRLSPVSSGAQLRVTGPGG